LAGQIEAGDLLVALRSLGFEPRKDEVKKLMSDNDKDNSGKINKQQFVEIFRAKWVSIYPFATTHYSFLSVCCTSLCFISWVCVYEHSCD
jgi:hypothetical protein